MVKAESLRDEDVSVGKSHSKANYDYLKEIIKIARKNGWDMKSLGLVRKDLPRSSTTPLTKKQFEERNRVVVDVLERFSDSLTPPVPPDLEKSILSRTKESWLPWEAEAIGKVDDWREELKRIKPEVLKELNRAC